MKAARFGLRALCKNEFNSHILIRIDNTSAASAINKMGSVKSIEMDNKVHLIWEFISTQNNWLTATQIPGIFNVDADRESRKQELRTEWMLDRRDFHYVTKKLNVSPSIELFASRLNTQLPEFMSYRPDPESKAVNAFTQSWTELKLYAFPPFICLPRVIQKIWQDRAEGILVVPDWPNQLWYSQLCNKISSYHRQTQISATRCTRLYN